MLDERMSCEPVALKVINKINGKLKFLYRQNRYLTKEHLQIALQCSYSATCVPSGTLIPMKNKKENTNNVK